MHVSAFSTGVSGIGIGSMGLKCSKLEYVDVFNTSVGDAGTIYLGRNCHALTHLNMSWCTEVGDMGIESVARGCPLLRNLLILGTSVGDPGLVALGRG